MTEQEKQNILAAIKNETPIIVQSSTLSTDTIMYIGEVISYYFSALDKDDLIDHVKYCVQELATNAKKANTKRLYFAEKGLDLFNKDEYEKGMENFKEETFSNIDSYMEKLEDAGLYIKFSIQKIENEIIIEIRNNSVLTEFEFVRILEKLEHSKHIVSTQEAFDQILDNSEGAGLGIIIMILMLKKSGLSEKNLSFIKGKDETIVRLTVDLTQN